MRIHSFPNGICPKVKARLEYELVYYDSAVYHFNHNTTRTSAKDQDKVFEYTDLELSLHIYQNKIMWILYREIYFIDISENSLFIVLILFALK